MNRAIVFCVGIGVGFLVGMIVGVYKEQERTEQWKTITWGCFDRLLEGEPRGRISEPHDA